MCILITVQFRLVFYFSGSSLVLATESAVQLFVTFFLMQMFVTVEQTN